MKDMKILILICSFHLKTTCKVSRTDIIVPILTVQKKWNLREVKGFAQVTHPVSGRTGLESKVLIQSLVIFPSY